MKRIYSLISVLCLVMLFSSAAFSQGNLPLANNSETSQDPIILGFNSTGELAESIWQKGEQQWKESMIRILGLDEASLEEFLVFNQSEYFKDRGQFFQDFAKGTITDQNAQLFFDNLEEKYTLFWKMDGGNYKTRQVPVESSTHAACNPSCYNISFQDGTLSGWNAYYAIAASKGCTSTISNQQGGACGAVTQSGGPNPNTGNSYHVQLMTTPGSDPIAGGFIPLTPPLGGTAAMIGDGNTAGHGVGVLEQTYMVDVASPILTLQYAVVLESPGHTCAEQPWFKIDVLDQNGTPVPGCGQYFVYASGNLPGFKAIYYPPGGDTVYCRPWSTAFVPLYNYIGQCVTVRFTASDCAHGGHFGYGYVAATCSKLDLVSSSPGFCIGQTSATITGPPGAASYQWTTPNGCIPGSTTGSSVTITCAGTYHLVTQSTAGVTCVDTFSITIPNIPAGPLPVPCFTATKVCSGTPTVFDASCSGITGGAKYYWDFYNTGHYDDSSGANPSFTFSSGGFYSVRLHIVTANGCGADTIISIPVDSTNNFIIPSVKPTVTNTPTCNSCTGSIRLQIQTTSKIVIKQSINTGTVTITPPGSLAATGCGCSIGIGSGTFTLTWNNLCPGIYTYYITPSNPSPPTNCSPNGFVGDTLEFVVGTNGVNITANITSSAASCGQNNGSASLAGLGGTSPYSYSWSTPNLGTGASKTGLAPGTYTVKVTDSLGCLGVSKVVIGNYPQLSAQVIPFNVSCYGANNGAIKLTPSAGTSPFTYSWSPNVSAADSAGGLAPGSYSILITDSSGCTGTVNATITQPTQVIATITDSVTQVLCNQTGSATVGVTGGYGPYKYKWAPSGDITPVVTGLAIGTHVVTVTDAFGCTTTTQVTVSCSTLPKAVFISSDTTFCNEGGQCIDFFDQSTGNPTSWQWTFQGAIPDTSTAQNPSSICYYIPGSYIVKLVVSGPGGTDSMIVNPLIIFAVGAQAPIITRSNDTLYCSPTQVAYQWYKDGSPIPGAIDSFFVITGDGSYNVYITDFNECSRLGNPYTVTAVRDIGDYMPVEIYPNPAGSQFTIYGLRLKVETTLEMFNAIGEKVYATQLNTRNPQHETIIDVSTLSNGIYTLRILSGNESINKKIIVVHK